MPLQRDFAEIGFLTMSNVGETQPRGKFYPPVPPCHKHRQKTEPFVDLGGNERMRCFAFVESLAASDRVFEDNQRNCRS